MDQPLLIGLHTEMEPSTAVIALIAFLAGMMFGAVLVSLARRV